jgi:hypothetical protein
MIGLHKTSDGKIAIIALIAFAAWLFVGLPLLYLPSQDHVPGELLGVKYGEWLLFLATAWLAGATWRLVKGADNTAERQLRAYVSVESGANGRQRKGYKFDFRPVLTNNGVTPAEDVQILSNVGLAPPIIPENFDYSLRVAANPSVTTIGPRQGRVHAAIFHRPLSVAELRKIVKGEMGFHVYGTVSYRDIFKNQRRTNFSFVILVPKKSQSSYWHYTERNNDAT